MDHRDSKIEQSAPFLVFTGVAGNENTHLLTCPELFKVCEERRCHSQSFGSKANM